MHIPFFISSKIPIAVSLLKIPVYLRTCMSPEKPDILASGIKTCYEI